MVLQSNPVCRSLKPQSSRLNLLRLAGWFRHRGRPSDLSRGQPPLAALTYQHPCEKHLRRGDIRADSLGGALADDHVRADRVGNKRRVLEFCTSGKVSHKPGEGGFNVGPSLHDLAPFVLQGGVLGKQCSHALRISAVEGISVGRLEFEDDRVGFALREKNGLRVSGTRQGERYGEKECLSFHQGLSSPILCRSSKDFGPVP